jgi:hypothetical protein
MASRLAAVGDLWSGMNDRRVSLGGAISALEGLLTEEDWREAMAASTRRPVSRKLSPKR